MVMAFIAAAIAMLIAIIPAGIVLCRGELAASVVAYEFITSVDRDGARPARAGLPALQRVRAARPARGAHVRQRAGLRPGHGALAVMARDIVCDILLGLAVLIVASASVGVLVMRDAYQKLHYVTPAALVAPALVAAAVFVQAGLNENTGETLVALAVHGHRRAVPVARHDPRHPGPGPGRLASRPPRRGSQRGSKEQ